jgi:hypothetical protein
MPTPVYVPILKGKEGEYAALEALKPDIKGMVMPLIEIPAIPYDYANERPAKSLDDHIADIPERLKKACAGMPFYLDLPWFGDDETLSHGQTACESILAKSATLGLNAVPVVSRESTPAYLAATKGHTAANGCGACIRLLVEDFEEDVDLDAEVERLLTSTTTGDIGSTDLIIDLEDLGANAGRAALIARSVFSMIPRKDEWRRMILAAASFPEDLSDVSAATIVTLPRHEWNLWKTLQRKPAALPRPDLIFGDYAMAHPIAKTLDPRTMRMSANIRYTTQDEWLVIKGRNVRQFGFSQYFDLCRLLVERPEYSGRSYSWGDAYIADCADATQGPGNATTWRKVGVNHHLTLVTRGLASLRPAV